MKRLASILGVLGGIGAILWAMRDRLVSVAIPREPQPPALKAPERPQPAPTPSRQEEATPRTLTDVSGIGPVYATRLEAAGITSLADLAGTDDEKVAEAADVTLRRAQGWIQSAHDLLADGRDRPEDR